MTYAYIASIWLMLLNTFLEHFQTRQGNCRCIFSTFSKDCSKQNLTYCSTWLAIVILIVRFCSPPPQLAEQHRIHVHVGSSPTNKSSRIGLIY